MSRDHRSSFNNVYSNPYEKVLTSITNFGNHSRVKSTFSKNINTIFPLSEKIFSMYAYSNLWKWSTSDNFNDPVGWSTLAVSLVLLSMDTRFNHMSANFVGNFLAAWPYKSGLWNNYSYYSAVSFVQNTTKNSKVDKVNRPNRKKRIAIFALNKDQWYDKNNVWTAQSVA